VYATDLVGGPIKFVPKQCPRWYRHLVGNWRLMQQSCSMYHFASSSGI
jgi:hypothetical protein